MEITSEKPEYRGKRAYMFLRISTPGQKGLAYQEKEVREKLIEPLGLVLDEEKHIGRDTHTGLEFRQHKLLNDILAMADRSEFDVLCMDVLDRLGRRGLERELYRMQLREKGVRILTTDPNDHADDDSLVGELVRYINGINAEKELHNTRRRTLLGKHAKAEGRQKDGTIGPRKVVGTGERIYGYTFVLNEKGRREGFEHNHDAITVDGVVLMDEDGTPWTEVKVVIFVFDKVIEGIPYRQIADMLNKKGIPCPHVAKGLVNKRVRGVPLWQRFNISRIVHQSGYWGEYRQFITQRIGKVRGKKDPRRKTAPEEQVVVPIPAIVSKETAEKAQQRAEKNQKLASRNNKHKEDNLLSGGLIKCAYCGGNLYARRDYRKSPDAPWYIFYLCDNHSSFFQRCEVGCRIPVSVADAAAWEKALEIIRDPALVDKEVNARRTPDPTADKRRHITAKLKGIRDEQAALQDYLSDRIKKRTLDAKTENRLTADLHRLAEEETGWQAALESEENEQEEWLIVQEKLDELHRRCAEMRENLTNPEYTPTYREKRDLLEFFGICVTAFKAGTKPPCKVTASPPSVMMHLSAWGYRLLQGKCQSRYRTSDSPA